MDSVFIIRVIISFFVAGIWIGSATLLAERFGSKIGGLITNLPSNILVSMLFISIINGIPYVIDAVPGIPIGMAINTLFLFVFIITLNKGLVLSTIASLLVWVVSAYTAVFINSQNFLINSLVYMIITLIAFALLEKVFHIPAVAKSKKRYTTFQLILRAIFAGGVVASVVVIAQLSGPHIVGIISTFPAVILSTMIILKINQNNAFAQATGKVLVISSSNIVVYAIAIHFTYPVLGIALGTIISFIAAFAWVWFFHPIVQRLT